MVFSFPYRKCIIRLIVIFTICILHFQAIAQISIEVTIDEGVVESTCVDPFGGNNPMFEVNIENEGWEAYPSFLGLCYNNTPNLQYTNSFACPLNVLDSIEVCFKVYDEDGIPCNQTTEDCSETLCEIFEVPDFGTSLSSSIEISGGTFLSTGTLDFTITTSSTNFATNDDPCDAIDMGVLAPLSTLGDATVSAYNNICSDGFNEPNPVTETGWNNNQGVWFKFTTSNNPSSIINILALDDPSNVGDDINLQLALYETSNDQCDGTFELVDSKFKGVTSDEVFNSHCLTANKTYFLLVDGATDFDGGVEGWFGLQIVDEDVVDGSDLICNAENMGAVPNGGMITTGLTQTNACATAVNDPNANNFDTQNSVWYEFFAPPSGNVIIDGISDQELPNGLDPVDIQIALFETNNNLCSGNLNEINSAWTSGDFNETISASCLSPGAPYWIMIDGSGFDFFGVFEVKVTDAGYNPVVVIDTTICDGAVLTLGEVLISDEGPFMDTIIDPMTGCVTPVAGTLSFLDSVNVSINQSTLASDIGIADGVATAATTGGAGNYAFIWSDGQSSQIAINLIGGDTYCVTATDNAGCSDEQCYEIEYLIPFTITTDAEPVLCNGGADGSFSINVQNAVPPYDFMWNANTSLLNGSGQILNDGDTETFSDLPADTYSVTLTNANFSEVVSIVIEAPAPFLGNVNIVNSVSCFGACDAMIEIEFSGGTNPLPQTFMMNNLCAGNYTENFLDGNGCPLMINFDIGEPTQIFAATTNVQAVTCFGAADGAASIIVAPDIEIVSYLWEGGQTTQDVSNLTVGTHSYAVVDVNGCTWTGETLIVGPDEPLEIASFTPSGLVCNGDHDGMIEVVATGGYGGYTYSWDNGQESASASGLSGGTYTVSVSDGGGCLIEETFTFVEPDPITADLIVEDGMCDEAGNVNGGVISIVNVNGGIGPYQYSMATENYSDNNRFENLAEGQFMISLVDELGCVHFYEADILGPDSVIVTTDESFVVFEGDPFVLNANSSNNNLTYQWSPASNVDCPTCPTTNASHVGQITYTVLATDTTTNCQGAAQIVVGTTNQPNIFIPNVFSPNGDGDNDVLQIYTGAGVESVIYFEIFSRWGDTVYGAQNISASAEWGWNGKLKGQYCNPGVYPYVAKIMLTNGGTQVFNGVITLLR